MLSRRSNWSPLPNRLSRAREERQRRGLPILDLADSNPTRVGIDYPLDELAEAFARGARAPYEPDPRGIRSAREALAEYLSTPGDTVSPDDLVLTASTSEAYGFLFKLLADPGDEVLTPAPTYPLLDHLAELESLRLRHAPMEFHGRWRIEADEVARCAGERTRLLVVVSPNNPTGSFLESSEQEALVRLCAGRGIALVSDEVFADYPADGNPRAAGPAAARTGCLTVSLGGLSKSCGLPHAKLGWIRVGGEPAERRRVIEGLELVADNYLSAATPVQAALPELLRIGTTIRARIGERTRRNLAQLRSSLASRPAIESLPVEGGWCAVLRVPRVRTDEELALELLVEDGVAIQPGFFFDFVGDGFLVLSLLPAPALFDDGIARLLARLDRLA